MRGRCAAGVCCVGVAWEGAVKSAVRGVAAGEEPLCGLCCSASCGTGDAGTGAGLGECDMGNTESAVACPVAACAVCSRVARRGEGGAGRARWARPLAGPVVSTGALFGITV